MVLCVGFQVGTKSVRQCVQFYYLWKKVCGDESRRLRTIRRRREQDELYNLRSKNAAAQEAGSAQASQGPNSEVQVPEEEGGGGGGSGAPSPAPVSTAPEGVGADSENNTPVFVCNFGECNAVCSSFMIHFLYVASNVC